MARQEQFVARLVVTKVTPSISVAEIIPSMQSESVRVDDRVILPARNF